jgi:agmatinase
LFDEELWCESFRRMKIATMQEFPIKKVVKEAVEQLESITQTILDAGKFPLIFGGEHSITAGSIRPFVRKYKDLAILHFDAHADLRDGYDGEHYSHAAALRRCLDNPIDTLVSIGIRNISAEEIPFLEANRDRIHIYWGKDRRRWDVEQIVSHLKGRPIYLTFDVDGFDSRLMPATGTPEPGGVMWDDAVAIIRAASEVGTIVGADINELAPIEGLHYCDFLAAKLAYKVLGYVFEARAKGQAKAA